MGTRPTWAALLAAGLVAVVLTAALQPLPEVQRLARTLTLGAFAVATAVGARRHAPTVPAVGWLLVGLTALLWLSTATSPEGPELILLGYACGVLAIVVVLAARRAHIGLGPLVDTVVAVAPPVGVVLVAAGQGPLERNAEFFLVADLIVLCLVTFTVVLPVAVRPALTLGLTAVAVSTMGDITTLVHLSVPAAMGTALFDIPPLLLAVAAMHPSFAQITTPHPLPPARQHAVRVLVLAFSLGATLGLLALAAHRGGRIGALPLLAPIAVSVLIGHRLFQWFRQISDSAAEDRRRAMTDALTGLAAVPGLRDVVVRSPQVARWSMVVVDLDGFRRINDAFGMDVGDEVLRAVAQALRDTAPPGTTVARLSADEFALLVPDGTPEALADLAGQALGVLRHDVAVDGLGPLSLTGSAGIASRSAGSATPDDRPGGGSARPDVVGDLARSALTAVGQARRPGGRRVTIFTQEMAVQASGDVALQRALQVALVQDTGEMAPHLQPIVDLTDGRIVALEALARWTRPDGSTVPPLRFLPLAEASGWIGTLGMRMLRAACQDLAELREHQPHLRVHVNASPVEADAEGFAAQVLTTVRSVGLPPDAVVLEITEQVFLPEYSGALRAFTALADAGIALALDDFGTGYASVGYLDQLPLHYIKVDKAFTAALGTPGSLLADLMPFLAARGATVIAEGIETPRHRDVLRALGCTLGQGFLLGRPLPLSVLRDDPRLSGAGTGRPAQPGGRPA